MNTVARTILVVDDEAAIREVVKFKMEREGFVVQTAIDGADALDQVAGARPDIIVLDLSMPKMDGYEFCSGLQSSADGRAIPIIVLSARSQPADRARCAQFQVRDFVLKPFSPRDLARRIRDVLEAG